MDGTINSSGEILEYYSSDDYSFIKDVISYVSQGNYIKLPTEEFITIDYQSIYDMVEIGTSTSQGYNSDGETIEMDFEYEV